MGIDREALKASLKEAAEDVAIWTGVIVGSVTAGLLLVLWIVCMLAHPIPTLIATPFIATLVYAGVLYFKAIKKGAKHGRR